MKQLYTTENLKYKNLFAGNVAPSVVDGLTVAKGQGVLLMGTVLGVKTTDGKGYVVNSTKTDGTEKPYSVLTEDIDTAGEDTNVDVFLTGEFNADALIFGGTDTAETHKISMRHSGMFIKTVIPE